MSSYCFTDQYLSVQKILAFLQVLVLCLASIPNSSHLLLINMAGTLLYTDPLCDYLISHAISLIAHKRFTSESGSPCLAVFSKVHISVT